MKDNFYITIETFHIADRGQQENVHELDKKALKERQVTFQFIYRGALLLAQVHKTLSQLNDTNGIQMLAKFKSGIKHVFL